MTTALMLNIDIARTKYSDWHKRPAYPWDETIEFTVNTDAAVSFDLALRIPGWCHNYELAVNDDVQNITPQKGYVVISREWQAW